MKVQGGRRGKSKCLQYTVGSKNVGLEFFKHSAFQPSVFTKAFVEHHARWDERRSNKSIDLSTLHSYATVAIVGPLTRQLVETDIEKVLLAAAKKKAGCMNKAHPYVIVTLSVHSEYVVFYGKDLDEVKSVCLVRNGVPQKLGKNGECVPARRVIRQPTAYYVRVQLPRGKSVTTNVANALESGNFTMDIDGLRKALKKELADELQGIGISRLNVYPPNTANVSTAQPYGSRAQRSPGGVWTVLQPTSEDQLYIVVVANS